jgi:hypothetical protein
MCITCEKLNDYQMVWCRFGCGCLGHVSEYVANDHVCGYGGSAICPHCHELVNTLDEVRSGGHMWEQDAMNHPLFGHEQVSISGDKSTFCQLYRESGNSLLAFHWKVPGQDPDTLNQAEVDELVEFLDADQLERWRIDCNEVWLRKAELKAQLPAKKKKHAPSQKARKLKARRAAAMQFE